MTQRMLSILPGWLVSMTFHMAMLIALAIYTLPAVDADALRQLLISTDEKQQDADLEELDNEVIEDLNIEVADDVLEFDPQAEAADVSPVDDVAAAAVSVELSEIGLEHAPSSDLLAQVGAYSGGSLSGRGEKARKALLAGSGGTRGSERAVSAALIWLAKHQLPDGGWSFDHRKSISCQGKCRDPGSMADSRAAATGLALLPFLGAGQTHKSGKYEKTVRAGLYFLTLRMKVNRNGGSLYEKGGSMYSHGIASIALCEAYAMTKDRALLAPAQNAVNFICYAQDPSGGGWRYEPQMPGDTSVSGWQIMALKSGHMAYLVVPETVLQRAYGFLNLVEYDGGARYGYVNSNPGSASMTAVGLLSRMYFGWKKDNPALERGVQWLSETGPNDDVYYNYYATQVMRHWGGPLWEKWNKEMREQLIAAQVKEGHESGSWYWHRPLSNHEKLGGRLYCTALATLILEVYYRHLPIFGTQSTESEFPIE